MIQNECISAIATPPGTGGVAIVRISGKDAVSILTKIFTPTGSKSVIDFENYRMYPGYLHGNGFQDFGMAVVFRSPRSFTGEDVVELHCHGGVQLSREILKETFRLGCRPAERGEFTKRAFLNGKLSLASAEGMVDMIHAQSLAEIRAGAGLYQERLTNRIKEIQARLTDILAGIAADIDYPEEDIERDELSKTDIDLKDVLHSLTEMEREYAVGKKIKQGVSVAICGKPNTGKSSLLNRLIGFDKAIVSDIPGTTRDIVEGEMEIDGLLYRLSDTAGIRSNAESIESIGITMAQKAIESADIVVFVSEGREDEEERLILRATEGTNRIKVFNKADIHPPVDGFDVYVSAKTGENMDRLKDLLREHADVDSSLESTFVIEERHYQALKRAIDCLESAIGNMGLYPLDILSVDIKECWDALGEITGETATEEIIDTVFAKFCVGK